MVTPPCQGWVSLLAVLHVMGYQPAFGRRSIITTIITTCVPADARYLAGVS